jgi:hypothetical protein
MQAVFLELRTSKELEKFVVMRQKLHEEVEPQIVQVRDDILRVATEALKQRKLRGLRCFARFSLVGAGSYFLKWKRIQVQLKEKGGHVMITHMVRLYRTLLHQGVLRWRNGVRYRDLTDQANEFEEWLTQIRHLNQ